MSGAIIRANGERQKKTEREAYSLNAARREPYAPLQPARATVRKRALIVRAHHGTSLTPSQSAYGSPLMHTTPKYLPRWARKAGFRHLVRTRACV